MDALEIYVIRSKDGKYLRAKGYSGYGLSWVTELKKAKVYTKRGSALGQITYWANSYPEYGVPDLVPLIVTLGKPIDQTERVSKANKEREIKKLKSELIRSQVAYEAAIFLFEKNKDRNYYEERANNKKAEMESIEEKIKQLNESTSK